MSTNPISMQMYAVVSGSTAYVVCPVRVLKQEGLLERSPSYSLSRRLKSYDVTMNLFQLLIQKQERIIGAFAMFASMYRKECDECGGFLKVSQNMRCTCKTKTRVGMRFGLLKVSQYFVQLLADQETHC